MDDVIATIISNYWDGLCRNVGGTNEELWAHMRAVFGPELWAEYAEYAETDDEAPWWADDRMPEYEFDDRVSIRRIR